MPRSLGQRSCSHRLCLPVNREKGEINACAFVWNKTYSNKFTKLGNPIFKPFECSYSGLYPIYTSGWWPPIYFTMISTLNMAHKTYRQFVILCELLYFVANQSHIIDENLLFFHPFHWWCQKTPLIKIQITVNHFK